MNNITAQELSELMAKNNAVIIDVREPFEHHSVKINGAILMPSSDFHPTKIPVNSGQKMIFHCKSGRRSVAVLSKLNNSEYLNLDGGIDAWIAAGFPVIKAEKQCIPLDRQVQITIGMVLVLAFFLTYFLNIHFAFMPLIIGCGLVFAGLSGFCGLAIVLAKAPWNRQICNVKSNCSL